MEIKILENNKTRLQFELKGESHSFCTILRSEIIQDEHVKVGSYNLRHPLIGSPNFIVETDGKKAALDVVQDAVKRLSKDADKVKSSAKSVLK